MRHGLEHELIESCLTTLTRIEEPKKKGSQLAAGPLSCCNSSLHSMSANGSFRVFS